MARAALLAAAPILLVAAPAAARFSPPDGTPFRYVLRQTRIVDGRTYHGGLTRKLVFRREAGGWLAELTTVAIDQDDQSNPMDRLRRALDNQIGQTRRFHLDEAGTVVSVENADAIWANFVAQVRRIAKPELADRLSASLVAMPIAQRQVMLASPLASVIAAADTDRETGARAVSLPGLVPGPASGPIAGTEHVALEGETVVVTTEASNGATQISRRRVVSRASGLILHGSDSQQTAVIGDGPPGTSRRETSIDLAPW